MSKPARYDWDFVPGNTLPIEARFPFDCAGDNWVLRIVADGTQVLRKSVSANTLTLVDLTVGPVVKWAVSCTLSPEETRAIPAGSIYELERRVSGGEERTYIYGMFKPTGGVNDDV